VAGWAFGCWPGPAHHTVLNSVYRYTTQNAMKSKWEILEENPTTAGKDVSPVPSD